MNAIVQATADAPPRTALVTGSGGIGGAVALALAAAGDRVVLIGSNRQRGAEMLRRMKSLSDREHRFFPADLTLMKDVARTAAEVTASVPRLDAVVFCAGVLSTIPEWTDEGLERNFALNYLSRYLMARLLLPAMQASPSGRLVFVANAGVYRDSLDFGDLQLRRGKRGLKVAGRTQFANDLLAVELADRVGDTGVAVTCVFPGYVRTDVFANARGLPWAFRLIRPLLEARSIAPETAADTPAFLAHDAEAANLGGRFFGPRRVERPVPERARRAERRRELWRLSEDLVRSHL